MIVQTKIRGGMQEMFLWLKGRASPPMEVIVEGPAGTGKTFALALWLKSACDTFPRSKWLLLRETRVSLNDSFLDVLDNDVLGYDHPAVLGGPSRSHRERYVFSNGSEIVLGGYDNPRKLFSTSYNGVVFNEVQESTEEKWEFLNRALRRPGTPWRVLIGDCNPDDESHWVNRRCERGQSHRVVTHLWDNPSWYQGGDWTSAGREYVTRLSRNLSGTRRERLLLGRWCRAEGLVWPEYDPAIHLVSGALNGRVLELADGRKVEMRWFIGGMDAGYESPGCFQVWGGDASGNYWRVVEVYRRRWDHDRWARAVLEIAQEIPMQGIMCDHDKALIALINRHLGAAGLPHWARAADKTLGKGGREGKKARIEIVRTLFKERRIFLLRDSNRHVDKELADLRLPTRTEQELNSFVYGDHKVGEDHSGRADDPDPRCADHGCDAMMYALTFGWDRDLALRRPDAGFAPGTMGRVLGRPKDFMRRNYMQPVSI